MGTPLYDDEYDRRVKGPAELAAGRGLRRSRDHHDGPTRDRRWIAVVALVLVLIALVVLIATNAGSNSGGLEGRGPTGADQAIATGRRAPHDGLASA